MTGKGHMTFSDLRTCEINQFILKRKFAPFRQNRAHCLGLELGLGLGLGQGLAFY
jgi:hypothetical protein